MNSNSNSNKNSNCNGNNNYIKYGNIFYSENNTGENSTLLNQKHTNIGQEETQKIFLLSENSENFFVTKNKKRIKIKKKDIVKKNIISNNSNSKVDQLDNSHGVINTNKNLYGEEVIRRNNINKNTEEINTIKEINYFNVDDIFQGDERKFK